MVTDDDEYFFFLPSSLLRASSPFSTLHLDLNSVRATATYAYEGFVATAY